MNDYFHLILATFAFPTLLTGFVFVLALCTLLGVLACRHDKAVLFPMLGFFILQIPLFFFTLAAVQQNSASLLGLLISGIASELLLLQVGRKRKKH